MDECPLFLTRQTIVRGELVTVHSIDVVRWFSRKRDIRRFEAKRAKQEKNLVLRMPEGVTLGRFTL